MLATARRHPDLRLSSRLLGIGAQLPQAGTVRIIIAVLLALLTGGRGLPAAAADLPPTTDGPSRTPNIVVLLADDLGYGETGCQGNPQIPTPHIDALARSGVRFTNGYVTAPFCSASRAGLLTGRYQTRFGYEFNPIGEQNEDPLAGLPADEMTLSQHLHNAGYATGLIGKWHLGGTAAYHPFRRGFDEFFGFLHEGHYFVPPPYRGVTTMLRRRTLPGGGTGRWTSRDGRLVLSTHMGHDEPAYDADNPLYRGGQPVDEPLHLTDAFTREAVDFIGRNAERPFILYVAYNAVHSPLQGADRHIDRFSHIDDVQRRIFAAMLSHLDDSVGAVMAALEENGLQEDTLVFFLSDNGGPTRELTSSNAPLRGEKGTVYEGGIRVPFLASWPGRIRSGAEFDPPVVSLDIFATAAAAVRRPVLDDRPMDGVDLLPWLQSDSAPASSPHESLFWRTGSRTAVRMGSWKLLRNPGRGSSGDWELYDLTSDVAESRDLARSRPDIVAELQAEWTRLNSQMIDPVWPPRR